MLGNTLEFLLKYPFSTFFDDFKKIVSFGLINLSPRPHCSFLLSEDQGMLLVKSEKSVLKWEPHIKKYLGHPEISLITNPSVDLINPFIPSKFVKEIVEPFNLMKNNFTTFVFDDPSIVLSIIYTGFGKYSNWEEVRISLESDTQALIPLWDSINMKGDYSWEILNMFWEPISENDSIAEKAIACGYPKDKIWSVTRWGDISKYNIESIIPLEIAVNNFFSKTLARDKKSILIYKSKSHINLSLFTNSELSLYSSRKVSGQALNMQDIADEIEEIFSQEEEEGDVTGGAIKIWIWDSVDMDNLHPVGELVEEIKDRGINQNLISVIEGKDFSNLFPNLGEELPSEKEFFLLQKLTS